MENFEIVLLSYSALAFISYLTFIIYKFGFLSAISASYYELRDLSRSLFTFFIWSVALPLMIVGVSETPFMFFAGAFLSFVGAAPQYKDGGMEERVHNTGAIGGIGFGFLSMLMVFEHYWLCGVLLGFVILSYLTKFKNYIWWIEILAFVTIYSSLIIYKLN